MRWLKGRETFSCKSKGRKFSYHYLSCITALTLIWALSLSFFSKKVDINRQYDRSKKKSKSKTIDNRRINISSCDLISIIFNERVREMSFSQFFLHLPFPIGDRAVAPTKKNSKPKPWESRCANCYQMRFSCFRKYPGKKIEADQSKMEEAEKNIEKLEHSVKLNEWWIVNGE